MSKNKTTETKQKRITLTDNQMLFVSDALEYYCQEGLDTFTTKQWMKSLGMTKREFTEFLDTIPINYV